MKPLLRLLAVGTLLTAATSFAADAFEGKVSLALTTRGRVQNIEYAMKGTAIRMDMSASGHSVSNIMDLGKHEMTMLMHEQHMYMVMPLNIPAQATAQGKDMGTAPDIEKTGKTETILGYTCHQVLVKDSRGTTTEMWLAEGLGTFMGLGGGGNPFGGGGAAPASKWEQALKGIGGFPMRVTSHDAGSKETFTMEVTKVTPGPQPEADFQAPAGYQKFAMPGGMHMPGQ